MIVLLVTRIVSDVYKEQFIRRWPGRDVHVHVVRRGEGNRLVLLSVRGYCYKGVAKGGLVGGIRPVR